MHFPENCQFIYPWRDYQARLLQELESHLDDNHLHLIAPPGSGKTVIGLEIARRINQPTLILAPTLAIRDQWIQRFCDLFLETKEIPDWISFNIKEPKFITVSTYQGMHAAMKEETVAKVLEALKKAKVKTLVADEAHHLKNAWWKSLNQIKTQLKPTIIGLTATPPYDVSGLEWQRYVDFNGDVDAEISVPELVKNHDLCPHQDYVYYSLPTQEELAKLQKHQNNIQRVFAELKSDEQLVQIFQNHPVWVNPFNHLEWIYTNLEKFSSILIFLHANQIEIPEKHIEIFGEENVEIPLLEISWMEILLNFYLFEDDGYLEQFKEQKEALIHKLKRFGTFENNRVNLFQTSKTRSYLTRSLSKINGVYNVFSFEHQQLGNDMRMVILTDFIRKEILDFSDEKQSVINKIGVIPIFEYIRRNYPNPPKMVVLTGSIIIVPKDIVPLLSNAHALNFQDFPFDENYVLISSNTSNFLLQEITNLFQKGEIQLIVGTKSLLGEGWDAPAINTLLLASAVGSFVTSNQMRGRAIRRNMQNPDKVANIWHFVCIDPTQVNGGADLQMLQRRFKSFVGPTYANPLEIQNGIERLQMDENLNSIEKVNQQNQQTFQRAKARENLKSIWGNAIDKGTTLVREIKISFPANEKFEGKLALYWNRTLQSFFAVIMSGLFALFSESILNIIWRFWSFKNLKEAVMALVFALVMTLIYFSIDLVKSFKLYIKYRDITQDIEGICKALLKTLVETRFMETPEDELHLTTQINEFGEIYCYLNGGSRYEKSLYIQCLEEILNPIENPRYILIRESEIFYFKKQSDYHNVPEVFARNKKFAEKFAHDWFQHVGDCTLVYTRNPEGRKVLLKARWEALSAKLNPRYGAVSVWK